MEQNNSLQRWAAIATILALLLGAAALLRDIVDFKFIMGNADAKAATIIVAAATPTTFKTIIVLPTAAPAPTDAPAPSATPQPRNLSSHATASASSTLPPEDILGQGHVVYEPALALDGNPATSWVEGVSGPGIGERLTLSFTNTIVVSGIRLDIGFDRDAAIFGANNRVRRARIVFDNGEEEIQFDDRQGLQSINVKQRSTRSITIVIDDVYTGSRFDDTPIAEVEVWGYELP